MKLNMICAKLRNN